MESTYSTVAGRGLLSLAVSHRRRQGDRTDLAIAFNVVVDHPPWSEAALALMGQNESAAYFCVPYGGRIMIGTGHLPPNESGRPSECQVSNFLNDVNSAIDGVSLKLQDVSHILIGMFAIPRIWLAISAEITENLGLPDLAVLPWKQ